MLGFIGSNCNLKCVEWLIIWYIILIWTIFSNLLKFSYVNFSSRIQSPSTDTQRKQIIGVVSTTTPHLSQNVHPGASSNHPLRPLSTLDSGMYTSSDETDEDEPSSNLNLESSSHNTSQKMKFTTFGKTQIIREETLLEEGMESNVHFYIIQFIVT